MDEAAKKLEDFSGHQAAEVIRTRLPTPKAGLVIGELDGVLYTTVRDGKVERYQHKFRQKSKPSLAVSANGKQLLVAGGKYEFTEAGIEDR